MARELSLLKLKVSKWKYHVGLYDKGMISLSKHKKTIQELREKWVYEILFQKNRWDKIQVELKELRK